VVWGRHAPGGGRFDRRRPQRVGGGEMLGGRGGGGEGGKGGISTTAPLFEFLGEAEKELAVELVRGARTGKLRVNRGQLQR